MSDRIESFSFSKDGIDFSVDVVCFNECAFFDSEWQMTDQHKGGITVKNDNADRGSYKYGIPLNYSLAERIQDLRAKGDKNPSATAYQQARKSLTRWINASDYGFKVSASVKGIDLFSDEYIGGSFDYSYDDDENLLDLSKEIFNGDDIHEAVTLAKEKVKEILSNHEVLKNIPLDSKE